MTDAQPLDFSTVLAASVHDMKNSVGMLLASLESVIEDTPPENDEQSRRFSTLHYEASRINSELIQLLTLYRMQNKVLPVRIDEHFVIDILEDQIARNHTLLETRGVAIELVCDHDLSWYFDDDLLGSVVQNILVNCVRYTHSAIRMSAEVENDQLCITIADDGPGYPASMLVRPCCQLDEAEVTDGATHLGLYFAEKIAQSHRQNDVCGSIKLANGEPLGGGVFTVRIP
ncbi:sensor histidine kinase [Teredinibacter turnerae]|uniref:sensor histidine kinase n=1 Tax=Teredinibacter turnerae TaxID=2426 RepID=UPI000365B21E|nr:HAMP domain-containing sensor histidine kinase [Teredinibacter turnerae]